MNATDQKEVLALVREHFGGATDGDGPLIWDAVKGYDLADARHALVQHRTELGSKAYRPDITRVKGIAHGRYRDRCRQRAGSLRIVDEIRRLAPMTYPPDMGDIPVILAHFGRTWAAVEADPKAGANDAPGRVAVRVYVLSACRRALAECGVSDAEADAEARSIVGLDPGERVMRVRLFGDMPPPGQTAWDATKALAKAEFAQPAGA
jgi:hypothetical protein